MVQGAGATNVDLIKEIVAPRKDLSQRIPKDLILTQGVYSCTNRIHLCDGVENSKRGQLRNMTISNVNEQKYDVKNLYKRGVLDMQGRVHELTNEMNTAKEQKEVILRFMDQTEDIPPVVLDTLKQKVRKLKITVEDCELRLKNYE